MYGRNGTKYYVHIVYTRKSADQKKITDLIERSTGNWINFFTKLKFQNLYFDCGVCEVQYVPYETQNKWKCIKMSHFGLLLSK